MNQPWQGLASSPLWPSACMNLIYSVQASFSFPQPHFIRAGNNIIGLDSIIGLEYNTLVNKASVLSFYESILPHLVLVILQTLAANHVDEFDWDLVLNSIIALSSLVTFKLFFNSSAESDRSGNMPGSSWNDQYFWGRAVLAFSRLPSLNDKAYWSWSCKATETRGTRICEKHCVLAHLRDQLSSALGEFGQQSSWKVDKNHSLLQTAKHNLS